MLISVTRGNQIMLRLIYISALLVCGSSGSAAKKLPHATGILNRNINGIPADVGDFPSQLSLRYNGIHTCGAAIINADWVLTAAHCLTGASGPILFGTTFLSGTLVLNAANGTVHPISEYIIHPDYVSYHQEENDIAVVKVTVPFEMDGVHRKPIALPDRDFVISEFAFGSLSGWGETEDMGAQSKILRKVDVTISNQTKCRAVLLGMHKELFPNHLCADAPETGLGPCYGDYGGPLYVGNKVAAIMSWGDACKAVGNPYTIYTKVAPFVDWIYDTTGGPPPQKSAGTSHQHSHVLHLLTTNIVFLAIAGYLMSSEN